MRSRLLRTFTIAAILSLFAESATIILFTRTLSITESKTLGASNGFATSDASFGHGFQVLFDLLSQPAFGASIMLPQLCVYFAFLWAAALLADSRWARAK